MNKFGKPSDANDFPLYGVDDTVRVQVVDPALPAGRVFDYMNRPPYATGSFYVAPEDSVRHTYVNTVDALIIQTAETEGGQRIIDPRSGLYLSPVFERLLDASLEFAVFYTDEGRRAIAPANMPPSNRDVLVKTPTLRELSGFALRSCKVDNSMSIEDRRRQNTKPMARNVYADSFPANYFGDRTGVFSAYIASDSPSVRSYYRSDQPME